MKKVLLALLFGVVGGTALAQDAAGSRAKAKELCEVLADHAGIIMDLRQLGVPMSEVLTKPDDPFQDRFVTKAYKMPKFPEAMKEEVVADFKNEAFLECYTALRK